MVHTRCEFEMIQRTASSPVKNYSKHVRPEESDEKSRVLIHSHARDMVMCLDALELTLLQLLQAASV